MELSLGSVGFGFMAGLFSTLSPCVLPLLPLVIGPALGASRLGLPALAAGLVTSFVAIGLFVATLGFSIGLDGDVFRSVAAGLLGLIGVVLLSTSLQVRFASATGGFADAANQRLARFVPRGPSGQFVLGLLLGAVWSPCVGPTLGAASLLAAQGRDLATVGTIMAAFGLGTALPLLVVAALSRQALQRWRGGLIRAGRIGKMVLGTAALGVAGLILSGADRSLETLLTNASPAWLLDLTTRF